MLVGDALYDMTQAVLVSVSIVDPLDPTRRKHFPAELDHEYLLIPVMRNGQLACDFKTKLILENKSEAC